MGSLALALVSPVVRAEVPAQPDAAVIVEVEKSVEIQPRGGAWNPAQIGKGLRIDDRLRTGEFSRALIRLSDLTTMRLDELTTIEVSQAVAAGKADTVDVKKGGIYFFHRGNPGEVKETKIHTALANGAVRGTEFALRVGPGGRTTMAMFEGEVELTNAHGRVVLKSGEVGVVEAGRAPRKTAMIDATNIIQWCLYYPAVLDPAEFGGGKSAALESYRAGDLPRALRQGAGKSGGSAFRAALILSSGQVEKARGALSSLKTNDSARAALERMIAAVQHREWTGGEPRTSSEWLAESYYKQSRGDLTAALGAARRAIELSPEFGFAWAHAAELEFSFGRTGEALSLLKKSLTFAPANAQSLALLGFIQSAQNRTGAARHSFDQAIALDPALGNAWLGRGLITIREGRDEIGRLDLQTAAVLEPGRSALRSYLGKAFSQVGNNPKAHVEFNRATELDPNDPTPWLYSAIQMKQENRYNEAIADLEKSIELNENRGLFRSQFLLDQDRAIRGTNLASIYQNNGMFEQSVRAAVLAVNADYSSAPAHLFLSNSYDALRDPSGVPLRYEAGTFSELLVSNLLSPIGGGPLSQFVSQQEYSKLFEQNGVGFASDSQYFSDGRFRQTASQFGTVGNLSYALDGFYFYDRGRRPNNELTNAGAFGTFKLQLGPQDTVFFQAEVSDVETGDVLQRYDPNEVKRDRAARTFDFEEKQDPGLLLFGWHHEWNPGNHTLLLLGRLGARQTATADDTEQTIARYDVTGFVPLGFYDGTIRETLPRDAAYYKTAQSFVGLGDVRSRELGLFDLDYHSKFEIYSAELQHIATVGPDSLIFGGRYQSGQFDTSVLLDDFANGLSKAARLFNTPPARQNESVDFERISLYAYNILHVSRSLSLTAGVVWDSIEYPENFRSVPINGKQAALDRVSPKLGFTFLPWRGAVLRGAYTEGVSGATFDESIRLEPTQVAGFLQSYRGLISESLIGATAGSKFKLSGLSLEQKLPSRTYLGAEFNLRKQKLDRTVGIFEGLEVLNEPLANMPGSLGERDEYEEQVFTATVNQLIGTQWSVGGRYRYTHSKLETDFDGFDAALRRTSFEERLNSLLSGSNHERESSLHELSIFANYNHRCGFFARAEANWYQQSNDESGLVATYEDYLVNGFPFQKAKLKTRTVGLGGDDFWQFNVMAGYRFHRNQCEISCGLLNITGQDYRLSPVNPYEELARDRTIVVRCRLSF